jgi:hypothetical protein
MKGRYSQFRITAVFIGTRAAASSPRGRRGLRRRSSLCGRRSWVQIPLKTWMLVLIFCVVSSCVGRGLCKGLISRPKESYQVSNKIKKTPVCEAAKVLSRTVEPLRRRGAVPPDYSTLLLIWLVHYQWFPCCALRSPCGPRVFSGGYTGTFLLSLIPVALSGA